MLRILKIGKINEQNGFSQRAVWRKRGGDSPESLCGFGSFVPVRTAVEAPPAPSRWDVVRHAAATVR